MRWTSAKVRAGDHIVVRDFDTREVLLRHVVTDEDAERGWFDFPPDSFTPGYTYTLEHAPEPGAMPAWPSFPVIFEAGSS